MNIDHRTALNEFRAAYAVLMEKAQMLQRIYDKEPLEPIRLQADQINTILRITAAAYLTTTRILRGRSRPAVVVEPRWVAIYLCRKHLKASYEVIASNFEGKFKGGIMHHTNAMYACDQLQSQMELCPDLRQRVEGVEAMVVRALGISAAA